MLQAVLLDIDGTLVDSNDAHAHAWVLAFAEHRVEVDFAEVRRRIGMGGDKLMPEVSGIAEDSPQGTAIAGRRKQIFRESLPAHAPRLPGRRSAGVGDQGARPPRGRGQLREAG